MSKKGKAVAVDVFAGGFSLGVQEHFEVLAHFEESDYGVKTARRNFPEMPVFIGIDQWPIDDPKFSELDLLFGNPPCAAWSVAGYTKTRGTDKWRTDPRVECTTRFFELGMKLKPKVWVTESVTQAYTKGIEYIRTLEARALSEGCSVYYLLHNAAWLGLPQVRKRFFMVVTRGVELALPQLNWEPPPVPLDFLKKARPGVTMERSCKRWTPELLAQIKPGERMAKFWERTHPDESKWERRADGGVKGRPSFGNARLPLDRPGGAVVGFPTIHPVEPRFLSSEELQLLCGFPADYVFAPGGAAARASEIARGVCPPVGAWLARIVRDTVANNVISRPRVFEIDLREPPTEVGQTFVRELDPDRPLPESAEKSSPAGRPRAAPAAQLPEGASNGGTGVSPAVKRTPRSPQARAVTPSASSVGIGKIKAKEGVGRMSFLQSLIMMNRFTADEMVRIVRDNWPESKCSKADVSTQRVQLRKAGHTPPPTIRSSRA